MITDVYVSKVLGHPEAMRWEGWWKSYPYCYEWYMPNDYSGDEPKITIY